MVMRYYGGGIGHFKSNTPAQQVETLPEDVDDEQENTEGDVARDRPTQDVNMHDETVGLETEENSDVDEEDEDSTDPENYDYSKADDDDDDDDEGSTSSSDSESDEEESSGCASS